MKTSHGPKRGHLIKRGGATMTLLKTLIFTLVVPATVTIYLPYTLLPARQMPPAGSVRYLGLLPVLLGVLIYCWCAWDFAITGRGTPAPIDPPKELVARGLYRYVRNPMYVGVMSILIGEVLFFASRTLLWYALAVFVGFNLFVMLYEEPTLRHKFGAAYENYCAAVPRWLPRIR
ncbi:MAG: isoprenylcysteine carboxylmethyltransferase family protein [Acidobacteria bacterium]|nr:MAG: isoprenylcysteine carboxylmethyltransferase family protein [Acidobacteriota bacterium]